MKKILFIFAAGIILSGCEGGMRTNHEQVMYTKNNTEMRLSFMVNPVIIKEVKKHDDYGLVCYDLWLEDNDCRAWDIMNPTQPKHVPLLEAISYTTFSGIDLSKQEIEAGDRVVYIKDGNNYSIQVIKK